MTSNQTPHPWKVLTWSNRDGTGDITVKRYTTHRSAVRAADRIRAKKIVAIVEHDNATVPASHWRQ